MMVITNVPYYEGVCNVLTLLMWIVMKGLYSCNCLDKRFRRLMLCLSMMMNIMILYYDYNAYEHAIGVYC